MSLLTVKRILATLAAALVAVALIPAPASASTGAPFMKRGICVDFTWKVAPNPTAERSWDVGATYCHPFRWAPGSHRLDILTHGATYDRGYWDWPQYQNTPRLAQYSYVAKALADGRATLAYDRIGNGTSTRPLSTEITMASDAYVLHQLVQLARFFGYRHIASISHSYGSGVALEEAARYKDVTSVVVSGYLHRPSNPAVTAGNYPANMDPKFQDLGLDGGWLTSRPGVRLTSFHAPDSDPAVVAYDEVHKDLVALSGLLGFISARGVPPGDNVSNLVTVPILILLGDKDAIFCYQPAVFNCSDAAAVQANEVAFYTASPKGQVVVIPGAGHSLTLHPSNDLSYAAIDRFVDNN